MSEDDFNGKITKGVEIAIEKSLSDLPNFLSTHIRGMALSAIGFSTSFGRIEVDHCNGRNSVLSDSINFKAREFVEKKLTKEIDKVKVTPELKKVVKREFDDAISNSIRWNIETKVKETVEKFMNELIESLVKDHLKDKLKSITENLKEDDDIANPEFGKEFHQKLRLKLLEWEIE